MVRHYLFWFVILFCVVSGVTHAQHKKTDEQLVGEVKTRLLAVIEPVPEISWPPKFEIVNRNGETDSINAWSLVDGDEQHRKVQITTATLEYIIQHDANRLAFILGHELAHIVLRHNIKHYERNSTPFRRMIFSREDEFAADLKGMEIALAAGYSRRAALKGIHRFIEMKLDYPVPGEADHPTWSQRLERLDTSQAPLWISMGAFNDGTLFLQLEQYASAERCFLMVTREFPWCYEAWANLGYAYLMQYCDKLEPEDIRNLGVGYIMTGGFYRRPASLEKIGIRGVDEEIWREAVDALVTAISKKSSSAIAKENLGICYLIAPGGKDIGKATKYLKEAISDAEMDIALDPLARLTLLVNAGVADLAAGRTEQSNRMLDSAQNITLTLAQRTIASNIATSPLLYNRALLFASSSKSSDKTRAITLIEQFLRSASPASLWWNIAYDQYVKLCNEASVQPKNSKTIAQQSVIIYRPILSITWGDKGQILSLADPMNIAKSQLDSYESIPVIQGTNLVEFRCASLGMSMLGTDNILAIRLSGAKAPPIDLHLSGVGQTTVGKLHVGMSINDLNSLLGEVDYDMRELVQPDVYYRFYRRVGVAVREKNGKVIEIIIAQIPERTIGL